MKTYTKLDTKEAFNKAMDAGKTIQYWNVDEWMTKYPGSGFCNNTEYRTVEEAELPEQGDEIMVWDDDDEAIALKKYFVTFWTDKIYASDKKGGPSFIWNHWKPIDKKPVPRDGWIMKVSLWDIDEIERQNYSLNSFIHVREVLEDE